MPKTLIYSRPVANHQDYVIFSEIHSQSEKELNVTCWTDGEQEKFEWNLGKVGFKRYEKIGDLLDSGADIIDCSEFYRNDSISILTNFKGKRVITVFNNLPYTFHSIADSFSDNWPELIIARAPMIRNSLIQEGVPQELIRVIPSAVDTSKFKPGLTTSTFPTILFVGRLVPEKGLWDLIVAMKGLEAELTVIGDGDLRPYDYIAKVCDVKTRFLGPLDHDKLPVFMRGASILVVPSIPKIDVYNPEASWVEQFGMVLLEGMATGLPIIATDTGSIRDIVLDGRTGFIVPPRSWDLLADRIKLLLGNSALRNELGGRGRERVMKVFSTQVVGKALADAYQEIL